MSYISQNFRLFQVSNLSVLNFRIFLLMYPGSLSLSFVPAHVAPVPSSSGRRCRRRSGRLVVQSPPTATIIIVRPTVRPTSTAPSPNTAASPSSPSSRRSRRPRRLRRHRRPRRLRRLRHRRQQAATSGSVRQQAATSGCAGHGVGADERGSEGGS